MIGITGRRARARQRYWSQHLPAAPRPTHHRRQHRSPGARSARCATDGMGRARALELPGLRSRSRSAGGGAHEPVQGAHRLARIRARLPQREAAPVRPSRRAGVRVPSGRPAARGGDRAGLRTRALTGPGRLALDRGRRRPDGAGAARFPRLRLPLRGRHNAENLCAALATLQAAGLPRPPLPDALRRRQGAPAPAANDPRGRRHRVGRRQHRDQPDLMWPRTRRVRGPSRGADRGGIRPRPGASPRSRVRPPR